MLLAIACAAAWSQGYTVSTLAGGIPVPTPVNAAKISLGRPIGVAVGPSGDIVISAGHTVFRVDPANVLTRIAGTGAAGYSGDGGPAIDAQLN